MIPAIRATMQRRILVNYRVDPAVIARVLPAPFRPLLVEGQGVAGICLIRLGALRPAGLPGGVGLTSENAAHRVAVEWDSPGGPVTGVYVPRRDTSSRLASLAGGRLFPGTQHLARFRVQEHDDCYQIGVASRDGEIEILVAARVADDLMPCSIFADLESASQFFRCAPTGYTATSRQGVFDGVELGTVGWGLQPLLVDEARSSFFDDQARFPAGSAILDSAFLMGGLTTTWHRRPRLIAKGPSARQAATC